MEVPEGTQGEVVRRSPIGELTLELHRVTVNPWRVERPSAWKTPPRHPTWRRPSRFWPTSCTRFHPRTSAPSWTSFAAAGLRGRGEDIGEAYVAAAIYSERLLEVETELEDLIRTGPKVTGVFADNARTLADDITQTAVLADILRDNRHDLLDLYRNGARFTTVAGDLIGSEKANLACLISDFGDINTVMAQPQNLENLGRVLEDNHYFFGAVEQSVQRGLDTFMWFGSNCFRTPSHKVAPTSRIGRTRTFTQERVPVALRPGRGPREPAARVPDRAGLVIEPGALESHTSVGLDQRAGRT